MNRLDFKDIKDGYAIINSRINRINLESIYGGFTYINCPSNCKHCFIDGVQNTIIPTKSTGRKELELLNAIDTVIKLKSKVTFSINVTHIEVLNKFKAHFKMIGCIESETGYGSGMQYHALFFSNRGRPNKPYIDRVLKREESDLEIAKQQVDYKKEIKKQNKSFIDILLKVKEYKMDFYRSSYIDKMISKFM